MLPFSFPSILSVVRHIFDEYDVYTLNGIFPSKISELKAKKLILAHEKGLTYDDGEHNKVELILNISQSSDTTASATAKIWHAIQSNRSTVYLHALVVKEDPNSPSKQVDDIHGGIFQVPPPISPRPPLTPCPVNHRVERANTVSSI